MIFSTAFYSGQGGRPYNEDSVFFQENKNTYIAIVADGLGMYGGGEVASAETIDVLSDWFMKTPSLSNEDIMDAVMRSNDRIIKKQTASCKMKSTMVMLLSIKKALAFVHIGDSRLYEFKDGRIVHRTIDHSVSQMAVYAGEIKESEIRFHEDRNRLLRALGSEEKLRPEIYYPKEPVSSKNAFLLCTDGFWEYVLETEMEVDLAKSDTPQQWISYMLERAGKRVSGSHDNLSVLTVMCKES